MKAGSTLRFRVTDAIRGIESSTWSLVGSKNTGDLFFSGREFMGDLKLSLHESGVTRMAWTAQRADRRVEPGEDRVLSRWTSVAELPDGWAYVLRVSIPDSALSPILPPVPGRPRKTIVTLPPAGPGRTVEVRVIAGKPGCGGIRLEGDLEEVGRMVLGDGTKILVSAWSHATTEAAESRDVAEHSKKRLGHRAAQRPSPRAFGWGTDDDFHIAVLIDVGDPRPPEERPAIIPPYDGPSLIEVHEMPAAESPPDR